MNLCDAQMAESSGALSLLTGATLHSCLRDAQLTEAFQPSDSDLAQRASTPCAACNYQRLSQPSAANRRNAQLSF
ncbi:hypothetical protein A2U01_0092447, partial [Trifolium medium]|nr:hypothetical protein [Trifolium medium]